MKEYKFLTIARGIFKILAWFILTLGILVGLIVLIIGGGALPPTIPGGTPVTQRAAGLVFMVMGGFYFLLLYTIAEIIGVLLDIKASCTKTI